MVSTRLFNAVTAAAGLDAFSAKLRIQAVREQQVAFWVHVGGTLVSGTLQIRGSPDDQADALNTPSGAILHHVIFAGTPGNNQTKVDGQGNAVVIIRAMPILYARIQGTSGTETVSCWIIE